MAEEIRLLDLHAHYAMQLPFPPRPTGDPDADQRNRALLGIANRFNFQDAFFPRVTVAHAHAGGVAAFGSVLYDPADEFCGPQLPFENVVAQMREVEQHLGAWAVLARTPQELQDAFDGGQLAFFHCIEGGFAIADPKNVKALASAGVAYIILAHLLYRGVATCVNGIPCFTDQSFAETFCQPDSGLTQLGHDIAEEMCKNRIIIDITHASQKTIDDVFVVASQYHTPVIASHTGARGVANYLLNLSDETMLRIRDSGGMSGVIFFDHWLQPTDPASPFHNDTGVQLVVDTIRYIKDLIGGFEHIGIGTDLDGFIAPVTGLENYGHVQNLAGALVASFGIDAARQIMHENALRVLKTGWGPLVGK